MRNHTTCACDDIQENRIWRIDLFSAMKLLQMIDNWQLREMMTMLLTMRATRTAVNHDSRITMMTISAMKPRTIPKMSIVTPEMPTTMKISSLVSTALSAKLRPEQRRHEGKNQRNGELFRPRQTQERLSPICRLIRRHSLAQSKI